MQPLLVKECVLDSLTAADKNEALNKMVDTLKAAGYLNNRDAFLSDVLDREKIFSTYVGYGIGLPHGKSTAVDSAGLCIARLTAPVNWGDENEEEDPAIDWGDGEIEEEKEDTRVDMIVMIAVNPNAQDGNNLHLKLLASLSRLLMHDDFREKLRNGSRDEMYETLNKALHESADQ